MDNGNILQNGHAKGAKQYRRNWTIEEDDTLLNILEELIIEGHKGENGIFKAGTHEEACKRMEARIPGIVLTVKQVVNKLKRWSSKLVEVMDMLNTNGFRWDEAKKCVIVDNNQVLIEYLQKNPGVGKHANKEFKEFERLQRIFGKHRANGNGAKTTVDVINNIERENENVFSTPSTEQSFESPISANFRSESSMSIGLLEGELTGPSRSRKRKQNCNVQMSSDFMEMITTNMKAAMSDLKEMVTQVTRTIGKMPTPKPLGQEVKKLGLTTTEEEVDVLIKFAHNPQYKNIFLDMDDDQRMIFVRKIMRL
ncbi:hypothetical protein Cni_G08677 [Canna indica]|uniref:Myb/SANT-like domain-containing protein n=1 Tax=Canna indica TaxID=4628 RepID=A0AAQ3K6P5_9LILI|nr:hypothetical protein Cni_G08677 [Canna indica]